MHDDGTSKTRGRMSYRLNCPAETTGCNHHLARLDIPRSAP